MALTTRQTNLLVQQDWTKIYQTFKEADFQSYDFETLRKAMIDYLRVYYPEDFNDFIESSEYVALIDLIAFLGQSLAFRTDLNARENFIDTAERRDSVLKLARLINYSPKRNIPASGMLKVDAISTTESVTDSNGIDLANLIISWNDSTNDNWQEQFNAILNATLVNSQVIGKPGNSQAVNNVITEEYSVSVPAGVSPIYRFSSTVEGSSMNFEAVSASTAGKTYIYEVEPRPSAKFNLLYRNDNLGNSSNNTGYFVYFKQGQMSNADFVINESLPNRVVSMNFDNINNTDTWLYGLSNQNIITTTWDRVPAVAGVNIIYNKTEERNLYQVNSRVSDQVDLVFGDGAFANIPRGNFRFFYRQSNGLTYKITPDEMQNISIPIEYVSRSGRVETLTLRVSLNYTVANATARETLDEIRTKAPQQYYTQNRMITGEDYNIFPYTAFSTVLKAKAVNRTSSGVSRFLDVLDVTGKYSSTNIFASDGILYRDQYLKDFQFSYQTDNEIYSVIYNQIRPLVSGKALQHFYYSSIARPELSGLTWLSQKTATNTNIGQLLDTSSLPVDVGASTSAPLKYIVPQSMIRFSAGAGKYFTGNGKIAIGQPTRDTDRKYIYAAVVSADDTARTITLNQLVPTGAVPDQLIPVFKNNISDAMIKTIASYIKTYAEFGLRYDTITSSWEIVEAKDLGGSTYSQDHAGDISGNNLDASWLIKLSYDGQQYVVEYRGLDYYFESLLETKFYYDERVKIFDSKTGQTINDYINVMRFNTSPDTSEPLTNNLIWFMHQRVVEPDGHVNTNKVLLTFPDFDNDGVPDNPDLFELIVAPEVNPTEKLVYFYVDTQAGGFIDYRPVKSSDIESGFLTKEAILSNIGSYDYGQIFYAYQDKKFYEYNQTQSRLIETNDYLAKTGRGQLNFQYRHNSPNQRRIDPSPNNIMDLFILTKTYATDYLTWIKDTSGIIAMPDEPSNEELKIEFSSLENYKAMSDTIIYNSARFKPIFGSRAESSLRAKFKVVKNPNLIISDSDIKTSLISAVNSYFDIANWDFGETFYFSELSAYLHNRLSPDIASVIIVAADSNVPFGNLYQINAEPDEIIISSATVDDVEIISAITAAQINQISAGLNIS
jgi:hypothetical protein